MEKIKSARRNQNMKFQDKHKVERPFGQPYLDRQYELRPHAGDVLMDQMKSTGKNKKHGLGSKAKKDDELVKHMSNLPGYLQQVERGENVQEKALNFGVLDWERLEKWKYREKHMPARGNMKASLSNGNSSFMANGSPTLSSTAQSETPAIQRKQLHSHGSHFNSSYEERISKGVSLSRGKDIKQDLETYSSSTEDGQQKLLRRQKSSGSNYSDIKFDKSKRKNSNQRTTSKKEMSLSDRGKHRFSLSSYETMSAQVGETKTLAEDNFNLAHHFRPGEHRDIVLLAPKCSLRISSEIHGGPRSEIPHSCCSLPGSVATTQPDVKSRSSIDAQGMELQSDASPAHPCSNEIPVIQSEHKCLEKNESNAEPSTSTSTTIGTSRSSDQDIAEKPAGKGRYPSPSRRYSFSLSKMGRSFSFKEGSTVPQFSSTYATVKSGPVKSSTGLDNFDNDKANNSCRARSSPLRRLLDPLLKHKGSHFAETILPSQENLRSFGFKPITTSEVLQDKKREPSTVQAFLQVTIKNRLPFFKLVVDNSSEILAAALKKLPTSGKGDSSPIYAFYSVREINKKSKSWINQGSKEKTCGLGYNIVGQMKVFGSYIPDMTGQSYKDQFVIRESVLYSVDVGQGNKETPEFMPNRELAAIIVKSPSEKSNGEQQGNGGILYTRKCFAECSLEGIFDSGDNENGKSNSTVVILPGGIHGLPNTGSPSSLIARWRSGGSCDCGGWDVGCKLRILSNDDLSSKISRPSISCSTLDRFDLFVQGGNQENNKPIFSLAPFKNELYSVAFNEPISSLQAFSICVAVMNSQKSSIILGVNNQSEANLCTEQMAGSVGTKTVQGKVPGKYVPSPPPSPIGRV